jgi:3-deoxy-D-manno-octulosonate 8-phosphate phosphatase (KDO 8-P phosphatase)
MSINYPKFTSFNYIFFDFDGIFTNNKVIVDSNGVESVVCSRSDGLAISALKNYIKLNKFDINIFIISTEKNPVVKHRSFKLKLQCLTGINDKYGEICRINNANRNYIYLGNDLNDFLSMKNSFFSVSPIDAVNQIKEISSAIIDKPGGENFVYQFILNLFEANDVSISDYI